jgi:hypothetical protein
MPVGRLSAKAAPRTVGPMGAAAWKSRQASQQAPVASTRRLSAASTSSRLV